MRHKKRKREAPGALIFVFRKPTWHWGLPLFLLVLVWATFTLYNYTPTIKLQANYWPFVRNHILNLWRQGYTPGRLFPYCVAVSLVLLVAIYRGRYKITITEDGVIVQSPLGEPRILRWVDVDEVYILRIRYPLEGVQREQRKLILYQKKRYRWVPWRDKLVITNWQLDGYRQAERLAVQIAVPAIAERLRARLMRDGGKVEFGKPSLWQDLVAVSLFALGIAASVIVVRMWRAQAWDYAAAFATLAVVAIFAGAGQFRRRWYRVDAEHLYVIRRGLPTLKIPLLWLREAFVSNGVMKLTAIPPHTEQRKTTIKDKNFFRNRGVMLALIRLLVADSLLKAQLAKAEQPPKLADKEKDSSGVVAIENAHQELATQQFRPTSLESGELPRLTNEELDA
ncbi:MAG: hypothetical protein ACPL7D_06250 [Candidatus Sumerlaeaceae bacterium]